MSSFYDDASLVVIPSGYKTSKVYAEKPTDGSGDLAFTRTGDTATRVNSAGLIEKVRTNLLTYSNTFSNAAWLTSNVSVTSGQAGYDGTNNAWLLTSSLSSNFIYQNNAIDGINTFSIYCKAGTNTQIILYSQHATQGKYFDLSSGTVGANFVAAPISASIENVGAGWYRCSIVVTASTNLGWRIYNVAVGTTFIQNAQAEKGDIATVYIPTTTAAVSTGPVANVPRLDYLGSTCPRLLLEPTATALNNFSEQLDNAYWSGSAVVTANTTISPDGYQNADTLNDNTTGYLDKRKAITITANAPHTFSFFVKKTSGALTHYAGIGALLTGGSVRVDYGIINTTTGAINRDASGNINSVSYSSVSYGDYWRVIMTFTDNQSNTTCTIIAYPAISTNGTSISADAQGSNVFWGVNFTQLSYATSYIPTLAASATRGADACSKTGISSLIGQTEGTLFVDFVYSAKTGNNRFSISSGSSANWIFIATPEDASTNKSRFYIRTNNTVQVDIGTTAYFTFGQRYKLAFAYKSGSWAVYGNGTLLFSGTDSIAAVSSPLSVLNFFQESGQACGAAELMNQAALFPTRLTNAELATLTTL